METKHNFLTIAPELSEESRNLVLLLRTLRQGVAKIPVHEGKPVTLELRYPDFVRWTDVYAGPLSQNERELLALCKDIEYGDVYVHILDLGRFQILGDTVQRIRLNKIDWEKT